MLYMNPKGMQSTYASQLVTCMIVAIPIERGLLGFEDEVLGFGLGAQNCLPEAWGKVEIQKVICLGPDTFLYYHSSPCFHRLPSMCRPPLGRSLFS